MKILTVVGARPQFIKAAAVSRALKQASIPEILVHTGQHYDANMSDVFFEELSIPKPVFNLAIGSGPHGQQTGRMLEAIEKTLLSEKPDCVLVYGDTNSTLAGALAAKKLHIPVAHVEAGLRSFNQKMPEEVNRILTDRISDLLFCPSQVAVDHLKSEGIVSGVWLTGDVMYDCALFYGQQARAKSRVLAELGIQDKQYALATIHRPENTDSPENLGHIFEALAEVSATLPVIVPLHPRTRNLLKSGASLRLPSTLQIVEPVAFLDMVRLEQSARLILTDSGGVQKEALFHQVPCITMRQETEWVETLQDGWNTLTGSDPERIRAAFARCLATDPSSRGPAPAPYGDGKAAERIASHLK